MHNKKILIVNTTLDKGGAARVARDLFEHVDDVFDIFFAYGRGEKHFDKKTFKFGNNLEVFIHVFFVRFLGLEGFGSYFSTRKLIGYIKKEKFDLVHLHNLHGYYLNFFTLVAFLKQENIPVVWTLHDEWAITWLPAHSMGCDHCKSGVGICTNTYTYPRNYFPFFARYMLKKKREVFSSGWSPTLVCPSRWLQRNIADSFLGKFDIRVISNGVDINLFAPTTDKDQLKRKYNLPLGKNIVLFSASNLNDASKGIGHIISAAKLLQDKNYLFLCVGGGKIEGRENIKGINYIYDKIKFAEICSIADLCCLASTAETFSLAAVEALSCGVPVVGFDIPVVREIVNDDVGMLVEPSDEKILVRAITYLLDNDRKRNEMGINGRELVVNNYSDKLFYKRYSDLYHEILI
jgi:glycosyltransferase involved in cell wall biosynthesis